MQSACHAVHRGDVRLCFHALRLLELAPCACGLDHVAGAVIGNQGSTRDMFACVCRDGISESAFYNGVTKGMRGEEPYADKVLELLQYARERTGRGTGTIGLSWNRSSSTGIERVNGLVFGTHLAEEFAQ